MLNVIAIAVSIFVIFFLPGCALYIRFLLPSEDKKPRGLIEDLFFIVFSSFLLTTVAGIILALLGAFHFSILFLLDFLFSLIVFLTKREFKLTWNLFNFRLCWQDILLLNIILIASFIYLLPSEDIFGGMDSGIYVNTGINLVREGKLVFSDPLMQKLPDGLHSSAASVFKLDGYGLYFRGEENQDLVGQFLPGYPVWLAISYSLMGLESFLVITPVIALMGLVAVYLLGSYLFSKTAGLIGVFLLSINILYLWFARQPLSEIMANLLIFGGAYYLSRFFREKIEVYAQIAGISFGTALLVRLDSVLMLIPLCIVFLYYKYKGFKAKGRYQTFLIVTAFILLTAVASIIYFKNYFKLLILYFLDFNLFKSKGKIFTDQLRFGHILILAGAVFLSAFLIFLYKNSDKIKKKAMQLKIKKDHLLIMSAGLLSSVIIFQIFIRPSLPFRFMSPQANSLKRLGWYFLPLKALGIGERPIYHIESRFLSDIFVIFFCVCVVFAFMRSRRSPQVFAFVMFLVYSVVYFNDLMTVPNHFWLNRRYVSVILPFVFICAGYLLAEMIRKNIWSRIISILLLCAVSFSFINASYMIAGHQELGRSISQMEQIAGEMKDDALYILDAEPGLQYHLLSLPLKYIFGKNVVLFENSKDNQRKLSSLIPSLRESYSEIYYCSNERKDFSKTKMFLTQEGWQELLVRRFEHTTNIDYRPPSKILDMRITMLIFRIEDRLRLPRNSRFLNIGTKNENFLADGFYNPENWSGTDIRWTMNMFSLFLPRPADYNTIVLKMTNGRPPHEKPPLVSFFINGKKIDEFYVLQGFLEYKLKIPDPLLDELKASRYFVLDGLSDIWMPKKSGVNKDIRELGVAIDSISLIEEVQKNEKPLS